MRKPALKHHKQSLSKRIYSTTLYKILNAKYKSYVPDSYFPVATATRVVRVKGRLRRLRNRVSAKPWPAENVPVDCNIPVQCEDLISLIFVCPVASTKNLLSVIARINYFRIRRWGAGWIIRVLLTIELWLTVIIYSICDKRLFNSAFRFAGYVYFWI